MTRKDYINIAYALRNSYPHQYDSGDDASYYAQTQWERSVMQMVQVLKQTYANFNEGAFLIACGYRRRPDGAMYTMNWNTGKPM